MGKDGLAIKLVNDYSVVTTEETDSEFINPLCVDNKIHIRFKEYRNKEVIAGLEAKLTYLLTYVFNKDFIHYNVSRDDDRICVGEYKYIWDKYSAMFIESASYKKIEAELKSRFSKMVGINLLPQYKKHQSMNPWNQFGSLKDGTYVALFNSDGTFGDIGSLELFLECFNTDLSTYLFDDAYYLVIDTPLSAEEMNKKFINKTKNKKKKQTKVILPVNLW